MSNHLIKWTRRLGNGKVIYESIHGFVLGNSDYSMRDWEAYLLCGVSAVPKCLGKSFYWSSNAKTSITKAAKSGNFGL